MRKAGLQADCSERNEFGFDRTSITEHGRQVHWNWGASRMWCCQRNLCEEVEIIERSVVESNWLRRGKRGKTDRAMGVQARMISIPGISHWDGSVKMAVLN